VPRIFDNINLKLLPALEKTFDSHTYRADFCVGYFNLRGWCKLDQFIEPWVGGPDACCRLLIGMQTLPQDELRTALSLSSETEVVDNAMAARLKRRMAEEFRSQLTIGAPTAYDEAGLRRLSTQLKAKKVIVKLFLRHHLHAKLYLLHRHDYNTPIVGFLGSSNLTLAGLDRQGELNVDVTDTDAGEKLHKWFNDRWNDRLCLDISEELAEIIDTSWARESLIPPYHIYLKMAYHLSHEARAGLAEFSIPRDFQHKLLDFQVAAVKIAAHHLNKRGGVLIGDVVGLGKTLVATALARIFQDDYGMETLIICPKNLEKMWQQYVDDYRMFAKVLPISRAIRELPELRRYKLVLIDESHNLRNREAKTFKAIEEYVDKNDSKCILLTATPYNKTFLDLSAQLRLFVPEQQELAIRPEKLIGQMGELEFNLKHQCPPRSLAAFEKSEYIEDWRELMRLYMVRRTRSFIIDNYAHREQATGRSYLAFGDGTISYFPRRTPRTVKFSIRDNDLQDPYARFYANQVVEAVNTLKLPRYGLGNYVTTKPNPKPNEAEKKLLENLGRAGQRLMGFSRTNLFKRLESGGPAFIQSVERHILRNYIFLHALEQGLDIPLGTQEADILSLEGLQENSDTDAKDMIEAAETDSEDGEDTNGDPVEASAVDYLNQQEASYKQLAAQVYQSYATKYKRRFKWLRANLFSAKLKVDLLVDARALLEVRNHCGNWEANQDNKLAEVVKLLNEKHPAKKVIIFSQFADTVNYLLEQLGKRGIKGGIAGVTGDTADPTGVAWRFSPESNGRRESISPKEEVRVLVATDVLSEGQNLQDASIVVNYDLPWAIIRLIQRAGRVDRIGQKAEEILCYSFLPADGVERIIRLRARVQQRLKENAEVVGTDETFFEDDVATQTIINLYNEQSGVLDGAEADGEVDLASYAYQIWKNALDADPYLKQKTSALPDVVYSTRQYVGTPGEPQGVLMYIRSAQGNDALAWLDQEGNPVTQSQLAILRAAECAPNTPAIVRAENHHALVEQGVKQLAQEEKNAGGQLGRPGGARFRTFQRLKHYADKNTNTIWESSEDQQLLLKALDQIYRFPMRQTAIDTLNRQLKAGINDDNLAQLVITLYQEDRLCFVQEEGQVQEPQIICSLGLFNPAT
jgi:superfamily II DNA or RNA helicase